MCGIVGFVGARADMQEILQGMMDAIAHRGPDGQGQFIEGPAALGQRRLCIAAPMARAALQMIPWRWGTAAFALLT